MKFELIKTLFELWSKNYLNYDQNNIWNLIMIKINIKISINQLEFKVDFSNSKINFLQIMIFKNDDKV